MTAFVLYDNVFNQAGATLVYSHEVESSGPFAHDMLLYDRWVHGQSSGTPYIETQLGGSYEVDTWSLFGHNFGSNGATITLHRYNAGAWTQIDTVTPGDDAPIFRRITPVSDTRFRIQITDPSTSDELYHAALGQALQLKPLNSGFRPPMFEQFRAKNSVNNQGVLLGRSVAKAARDLSIRQNAITTAELYSDFKGWLDHAARWPFIFCWDYANYADDSTFCWLDAMAPDPVYSNLCHLSIDMRVKAMLWQSVPST